MIMYTLKASNTTYPKNLKNIYRYPNILYCKGRKEILSKRLITIVGTRSMTTYGELIVKKLLSFVQKDLDVAFVSGLAIGIDSQVHKICLKRGLDTVAVIAGGIDKGFPEQNRGIYDEICKKGLVLAEFPQGTEIKRGMFPIRNRILAGLSDTTIVIEGGLNSGSLLTANLALEYGRDVFVIPGDITKNSSRGCNNLIKQGADVITGVEDFLDILGISGEQIRMGI